MNITIGDFDDARVKALLEYHLRGMRGASPPGHSFALDWSGLQKPEISFFTGWVDGALVVIGAIKDLGDGTGEIKSMRVAKGFEKRGHGAAMLRHIIDQARARGYRRLSLETGTGEPFEAAHKLYAAFGFKDGEEFGGYERSDFNRLMHLTLC